MEVYAPPLSFGHFPRERGNPGRTGIPCVRFAPRPLRCAKGT